MIKFVVFFASASYFLLQNSPFQKTLIDRTTSWNNSRDELLGNAVKLNQDVMSGALNY